jgi:hypothetical protein
MTTNDDLPTCCQHHDGPHLHGCSVPRSAEGRSHTGACLLLQSVMAV